jgi:hypothetical protein
MNAFTFAVAIILSTANTPAINTLFPKVTISERLVEIDEPGFPKQHIENRGHPPKIFWKCEEGYLLKTELMGVQAVVISRKKFIYPVHVVAQEVYPRPDLGGVFFIPIFFNPIDNLRDNGGQLVFVTLGSLCAMGDRGSAREVPNDVYVEANISALGSTLADKKGIVIPASPNSGEHFVALWRLKNRDDGARFLVCSANACSDSFAYRGERQGVRMTYQNGLVQLSFDYGGFSTIKARVLKDCSIQIVK